MTPQDHETTPSVSPDSTNVLLPAKRTIGRPFAPGNAFGRGRPRKGESFAEKYAKRVERDADALIEAHIRRAKGGNVVAERAFALAAAYKMGRPVQPYVVENADAPALAWLQALASGQGVDGTARELPNGVSRETIEGDHPPDE